MAHHLLPAALTAPLAPLLGPEATYAHLVTFAGMVACAAGVIRRGVAHAR